jgi:hypothetical protein
LPALSADGGDVHFHKPPQLVPGQQTSLHAGKRRPALVIADLAGEDLIPHQIRALFT